MLLALVEPKPSELLSRLEMHAGSCGVCAARYRSTTQFVSALSDDGVWQADEPVTSRSAAPGRFSEFERERETRMLEDQQAFASVSALTAMNEIPPPREALTMIPAKAGSVRLLLASIRGMLDDSPARSLALTEIALAAIDALPFDASYGGEMVVQLRGSAWKERANALRIMGSFPEALVCLDKAELFFSQSLTGAWDRAAVDLARAMILRETDRREEAASLASRSASTFLEFGDLMGHRSARMIEAAVLYSMQRFSDARNLFLSLIGPARRDNDLKSVASLFNNVAFCCAELLELEAAATYYYQALPLYQELGQESRAARVTWGLGMILIATGRLQEGIERISQAASTFEEKGLRMEAALASLNIVEALIPLGRHEETIAICRRLVELFSSAGATSSSMAALSYLREAATNREITSRHVTVVRQHLKTLTHQPEYPSLQIPFSLNA